MPDPVTDLTYAHTRALTDALSEADAFRFAVDMVEDRAHIYTGGKEVTDAIQAVRDWLDGKITREDAHKICLIARDVFDGVAVDSVWGTIPCVAIACAKLTDPAARKTMAVEACMRAVAKSATTILDEANFTIERQRQIVVLEGL